MTGIETALIAGSLAVSAAGAAVSYSSSQASAGLQAQQAALRREQSATELELAKLQQREQEAARREQADTLAGEARVGAIAQGYDPFSSPSFGTLSAFNERQAAADIGSIRLLGGARRQKLMLEGRGYEMAQDYYTSQASNSWIAPTLSLAGTAVGLGLRANGFGTRTSTD